MPWDPLTILLAAALIASNLWWLTRCRQGALALARSERELQQQTEDNARIVEREKAKQEALFDSMVEGVLLLDRRNRVVLINQAIEQLFGLSNDIRGMTVIEAFRLNDLQEIVNRTIIEGRALGAELEPPGLDHRVLQVNAAVYLNQEGEPQGSLMVFHDLTRIKQLENTRKEFVANVSHELRTPLSMIKGYVETLIDGAKNDPEVAPRFLQTIQKHADRLTYLIEDLLTISRLESGQIVLSIHPLDMGALARRVAEELRGRAERRNVTFAFDVPESLRVRADGDRLHQALFNLFDNAIKYGGEDSTVTVTARSTGNDLTELSVTDQGPGIPPEASERIFERFYRVDRARSREQGGTGLGLSIVKHIIQSHGGEVWARNGRDGGASFHLTLPAESAPGPAQKSLPFQEAAS